MKDKKCNGCEEGRIDGKLNKSGLCTKCLQKKWNKEHEKEIKVYAKKYRKKYYQEKKVESDKVNKKYYLSHKEEMDKYRRGYYYENIDELKRKSKEHYEENKEELLAKHLEYSNKRYKEDEGFRIRKLLGSALGSVIRYYIKTGKIANRMQKYNIDWKGIIKQLKPFPKNRKLYHVDHIIPLWKFDLTNWEQIHIAFAPENHRWMLAKDNLRRSKSKREKLVTSLK